MMQMTVTVAWAALNVIAWQALDDAIVFTDEGSANQTDQS